MGSFTKRTVQSLNLEFTLNALELSTFSITITSENVLHFHFYCYTCTQITLP